MAFRLFVDSSNGLTINPEFDYEGGKEKIGTQHRTRGAKLYKYTSGHYPKIKFSVTYVDSEFASIVNSWWESDTLLLFKSESETQVYSVQIVNDRTPLGKFQKPYLDLYEGKIELEGY